MNFLSPDNSNITLSACLGTAESWSKTFLVLTQPGRRRWRPRNLNDENCTGVFLSFCGHRLSPGPGYTLLSEPIRALQFLLLPLSVTLSVDISSLLDAQRGLPVSVAYSSYADCGCLQYTLLGVSTLACS